HASDSAKSAYRSNGPAADDEETGIGTPTMQARPDLGTEPLEAVNIGPIVEGADEDTRPFPRRGRRLEVIEGDAIGHGQRRAGAGELLIDCHLCGCRQHDAARPGGQVSLDPAQLPALDSVEP